MLLWDQKGFKILSSNNTKNFISRFVVRENPNPNNKRVTQLGTTITVTSIDIPLVLVMDKSNIREASRVTLEGLQGKRPRVEVTTPIGHD
jgi:hypothetical protein